MTLEASSIQRVLWWCSGTCPQDMERSPQRVHRLYAALGLLVLANLVLLVAAWSKVGYTFFGWPGLVVPGLVVPCIMVLGLDRLMAMCPRRLTGEFADLDDGKHSTGRRHLILRIMIALPFALVTTFTLLMAVSKPSIEQYHRDRADAANAPLRAELMTSAQSLGAAERGQIDRRLAQIEAESVDLDSLIQDASQRLKQAEGRYREARDEVAKEFGGLEGRVQGQGPRFEAYRERATNANQAAILARKDLEQWQAQRQPLVQEAAALRLRMATLDTNRATALAQVNDKMKADPRFVVPRSDLFTDTAAFVSLYRDGRGDEALGRWVITGLLLPLLVALECAVLLGLAVKPTSVLDVLRIAHNRQVAAEIVAASAIGIAQARAGMPAARVHEAGEPTVNSTVAAASTGAAAPVGTGPARGGAAGQHQAAEPPRAPGGLGGLAGAAAGAR